MAKSSDPVFPKPRLVSTTQDLADSLVRLRHERFLTIDTEFMRERTYWPELCLVQIGGEQDVLLIDALAEGLDLTPLAELMADDAVLKVFHAARQDLEIFLYLFDALPTPVFDTQVAAMVAGYGDQVGYDSLVGSLTGHSIDKSHRFTDWSARPLTPAQLTYAAGDVTWLRLVYERLVKKLEQEKRLEWVSAEMAELADPATFRADPEKQWERLRARTNNRRMLGILRAVAAFREREAQRVNVPRQRLLKDESLLEIAATVPATVDDLTRVRGVTRGLAEGRTGLGLLEAVKTAQALPDSELPRLPKGRSKDAPRPSPALMALLKVLLTTCCEDHDVAPKLVASMDDLEALALDPTVPNPVLSGWRKRIFGDSALALRNGEIALAVKKGRVTLTPSESPSSQS
ncbi:ribonuclease D [Acetobacter indonesiensis NRIC 0313]|uniref:Ribonuclease D n=1 Tax=Acetobacter indonesiensis TaxID=104101 RepID=A0A6N3T601_9PROT|nr:ribonuclease D [Acetobacter indonesiensis]GAN63476.1 ribonuclease D [Acetobacter indonesiensis]GBQ56097.1 ribonuclease D [Acetobacter indonesiensis NRIC 0313]GEN02859.1 ribonuclease D [Acetobacter indonesiensis]